MYSKYFLTGATGFLGNAVVKELLQKNAEIYALVCPNDKLASELPENVCAVSGDVTDIDSLRSFFENADESSCVIHCAGIVSIASAPGKKLYDVNVGGTENILKLCLEHGVGKFIYVSSVHAIPEQPKGVTASEINNFSPNALQGDYAKSKAIATSLVLAAAECGLNASVVHPSGIIGPGDKGCGNITFMLKSYISGKLPLAVKGGYDFVDVRDVAHGIVSCSENGRKGECYILSGHYVTVRELLKTVRKLTNGKRILAHVSLGFAKIIAPFYEKRSLKKKEPLYFTPYSISVLGSNAAFSHQKASAELNYAPRSLKSTLSDTIKWMIKNGICLKPQKSR